jgi:transposase
MGCDQAVLPNQPRGISRVDDRRLLNAIFYRAVDVTRKLR